MGWFRPLAWNGGGICSPIRSLPSFATRFGTLVVAGLMAGIVALVAARSPEKDALPRPVTQGGELNAEETPQPGD